MDERFNPDGLILSANYRDTMENTVLPALEKIRQECTVSGANDQPIYCAQYAADQPRGTVVIVHGFTENAYKFSELIYSLLQNHFDVVAYDQRGHGNSWRDERIQDTSLTHVGQFGEYVRDLEVVMDKVTAKHPKPWMVFCHSMGGAVTGLYLEKHADVFSRAVLCAPMIHPNLSGVPAGAIRAICRVMKGLGKGQERVFISRPYAGPEDFATSAATSPERFQWYDGVKAANKKYWNNGPTYSWTLEAASVMDQLLAPGAPEKIACPVRLYTAELDGSVMPEPQKKFIERVPQGSHQFVKRAKHEIYRSTDDVLFPWWHDVLSFFQES